MPDSAITRALNLFALLSSLLNNQPAKVAYEKHFTCTLFSSYVNLLKGAIKTRGSGFDEQGFIHSYTQDSHDRYNTNVSSSARTGYLNGSLHVIYGKINKKMGLFGYGLGGNANTSKTKSKEGVLLSKYFGYGGGPVFTYHQFKKIADKLYYGPSAFISPNYSRDKIYYQDNETEVAKKWGATFYITPFAFAYLLKENVMLQVELGKFQVAYQRLSTENSTRPNYKTYQSSFETQTYINNHLSLGAAIVLK